MSSGTARKERTDIIDIQLENEKSFIEIISDISIPFSEILKGEAPNYIYSGSEKMRFNERHPIFKALLKLEFEEVLLDYISKIQT
ncbi:MAG: hypothetical protein ACFFD5_04650 [Candidatus Thorarchaeota archaeon]